MSTVMKRALDVLIVLLAASLLLILALGGIDVGQGVVRIRLRDWMRPFVVLALALGLRVAAGIWGSPAKARSALGPPAEAARYVATRALLALLIAIVGVYAQYHVRVAGGLDSYGYVSTASLLASGRLTEPQPLVSLLPFEGASIAAAPLGYVPGPDGHTSSPRFPLGLPAVMAIFTIFGPNGPFFVPLLMAYATMVLAFLLGSEPDRRAEARPHIRGWRSGRERRDVLPGLFAAALVGVDPLMVDYGIQPMSDVPATCWFVAALWLRLYRPTRPILAGLCAGMALMTRPALIVAVAVLACVTTDRRFLGDTIKFSAILVVFVVIQMASNLALYGSVGTSGYGPASYMFELSASRVEANVSNFGKWLTHSHTALVWFLWPAGLWVLRARKWAWQISAVAAAAAAPYLFYLVFDDWESSRFLLPTIVLVLVLFARALSVALGSPKLRGFDSGIAAMTLLIIAFLCAVASHRFLEREGVDRLGSVEAKYALAGEWFRTHTSDRAVVLAGLHSGSIRFYGQRETIRWDQIPSDKLGATLQSLQAAGYEPYLALDVASEPPLFAERFRSEPAVRSEQVARVRVVNIYRFVSAR